MSVPFLARTKGQCSWPAGELWDVPLDAKQVCGAPVQARQGKCGDVSAGDRGFREFCPVHYAAGKAAVKTEQTAALVSKEAWTAAIANQTVEEG